MTSERGFKLFMSVQFGNGGALFWSFVFHRIYSCVALRHNRFIKISSHHHRYRGSLSEPVTKLGHGLGLVSIRCVFRKKVRQTDVELN